MAVRVGDLLRDLGDRTDVAVPNSQWSVGEMAAHLAFAKELMARMAAGEQIAYADGTREGLAEANFESLAAFPERNGGSLAGRIETSVDEFCRTIDELDPQSSRPTPLGPMPVDVFAAYLLTHLMQHGEAMARALRRPSVLDRASVIAATPFVFWVFERFVDRDAVQGLNAAYALHLRGGPTRYVEFDQGGVRVGGERPRRVDCHISADPVAFFRVGVRLVPQWGPILRFQLTTWGPKPWLAFRFAGTFLPP